MHTYPSKGYSFVWKLVLEKPIHFQYLGSEQQAIQNLPQNLMAFL